MGVTSVRRDGQVRALLMLDLTILGVQWVPMMHPAVPGNIHQQHSDGSHYVFGRGTRTSQVIDTKAPIQEPRAAKAT
jgi:hypothetical protein